MKQTADELAALYCKGKNAPTPEQWQKVTEGDMEEPLTVVNFFKLRDRADEDLVKEAMTGGQSFTKYTETSIPKVAEVGGHFILKGMVEGNFIGTDLPDWDIIAIGQYPQRANFLELLSDTKYQEAFKYRQAAVEKQEVYLVSAI